jgi:hypothetical protein
MTEWLWTLWFNSSTNRWFIATDEIEGKIIWEEIDATSD